MMPNPQSSYFACRMMLLFMAHFVSLASVSAQDSVEFLSGATMTGNILQIRKEAKEFDIETRVGERVVRRTYPYNKVHAVVFGGKRFELTPKQSNDHSADPVGGSPKNSGDTGGTRTKSGLVQLIEEAAETQPEWYESTTLDYPQTLDLSWPLKAEGPWNGNKNVGQYLWDTVSPNRRRWYSGIKLVHHCVELHQNDPELLNRDMQKLGNLYFTLLQDYPRAAFWFRKANVSADTNDGVHLAECYWRMGNTAMALELMRGNKLAINSVKLLGDMGRFDQAVRIANRYLGSGLNNQVLISLGDAARSSGKLDRAIEYYQQVLKNDDFRNAEYKSRLQTRAKQSIEAIELFDQADASKVTDGTFRKSSVGYNGSIIVAVRVACGRIESVVVEDHREKQFYAALTDVPRQIIDSQSVGDIDGTSGATITAEAIVHATALALADGAKAIVRDPQ